MAKVFISYSHQDEGWKNRVAKHLNVLAGKGLDVWDDRQIAAGSTWARDINEVIAKCDAALLLISTDFLTSDFILIKEVPPLLERRQTQGIRVIPVILSPCQWERIEWLKPINAWPKGGQPLSGMSEHEIETALSDLAGEVADLVKSLPPQPAPSENSKPKDAEPPDQARTKIQRQLADSLSECWETPAFAAFVQAFKAGLDQRAYFLALCESPSPYSDLMKLLPALSNRKVSAKPLSPEVTHAIALSALVLYERYCFPQGTAPENITAANLLFAAVQASACHGTDAVVKGSDAEYRAVANYADLPGGFIPFTKEGEADPEWEEIKRSLNFSAQTVLRLGDELCLRSRRQRFALRTSESERKRWNISDDQLRQKLREVEKILEGQFVFFVRHDDVANLACKYRDRIKAEFGVATVVWKKEAEEHDAADQMEDIFAKLFGNVPELAETADEPAQNSKALESVNN